MNKTLLEALGLSDYNTTLYDDTDQGKAAKDAYQNMQTSVLGTYNPKTGKYEGGYGPFTFSKAQDMTDTYNAYKGYGPFSYDVNKDALYQQYADKYIQQGKMAMADTMGRAAAMTGGYGNSYAQTAGQQQYQASLDNLNDIIPQLYQMALQRYQMGKQDLLDQYNMLEGEYQREYGEYTDDYNKQLDALGMLSSDYYNGADTYYSAQANNNSVLNNIFNNLMSEKQYELDEKAYEESVRQFNEKMKFDEKVYDDSKVEVEDIQENNNPTVQNRPTSYDIRYNQDINRKKVGSTTTYEEFISDLDEFIASGAEKSEINNYLRKALSGGVIDSTQYNELKSLYAPRGYTYR